MSKPKSAKVVHILFSVGPDDLTTMDDFATQIKEAVRKLYGDAVIGTVLYGEYQHDGKRYKQLDWEQWDGDPGKKPKDRYTEEPRAVAVHPQAEHRVLTSADVRKALDVHREVLGQGPRPITPGTAQRPVESLSDPSTGWPRVPGWEYDPWTDKTTRKRVIRRK